ncbi:MAG: HAMP domain-containing protein, partial [Desulfatitalea sp.]|nr:HAMP domain-containing protein [Desulfatitalea sp.]
MKRPAGRLFSGLQFKMTLLIEGMVVLLVLLTGTLTLIREKEALENELWKRGHALAFDLAKFITRPLLNRDLATLRRFINHTSEQDYVRYVMLLDPKGRVVMHSDLAQVGKRVACPGALPAGDMATDRLLTEKTEPRLDLSVPVQVADVTLGTVCLGYSYLAVEKEIGEAREQILMTALLVIGIGAIVSYFMANFICSPIQRITEATRMVADGNLDIPLTINRTDEIGILSASFNKMAEDLKRHRGHLQNLVNARTLELEKANLDLREEIVERRSVQKQLGKSREQLRDLASHLQMVKEEESKRIAREIHDELGQALTCLKFDLHWVMGHLPPDGHCLHGKMDSMSRLVSETATAVRRIASALRPGLLDDFGLSAAMEWHAGEFSAHTGIDCEFVSRPENIVLDQNRSIALFRIFQEALTNIARHAGASKVKALLRLAGGNAMLTISDNGRGMDSKQTSSARSFGIMGMRERIK